MTQCAFGIDRLGTESTCGDHRLGASPQQLWCCLFLLVPMRLAGPLGAGVAWCLCLSVYHAGVSLDPTGGGGFEVATGHLLLTPYAIDRGRTHVVPEVHSLSPSFIGCTSGWWNK